VDTSKSESTDTATSPSTERDPRALLPLRPLVFELLLLLQRNEQHGYALMRALGDRAERRFVLGPATLYRTLKELREQGLIEEAEAPAGDTEDERRRTYRLTDFGRAVAAAEAARLDSLVADARAARLLGSSARPRRHRA
jgi:DNA-binding PadR family transcriptional regulator